MIVSVVGENIKSFFFNGNENLSGEAFIEDCLNSTPDPYPVLELDVKGEFKNAKEPVEIVQASTLAELQTQFETAINAKIATLNSGIAFKDYGFKIKNNELLGFVKNGNDLISYGFATTGNTDTVENIQELITDVASFQTGHSFDLASNNIQEFDGFEFNLNAIKGANPFSAKLGITTTDNDVTVVNINQKTGNTKEMIITVFQNQTPTSTKITQGFADATSTLAGEDLLNALLAENFAKETNFGSFNPSIFENATLAEEIVTELNFTALENKIVEAVENEGWGCDVNKLMGYSINNGKLNIIVDVKERGIIDSINFYTLSLKDNENLNTQEGVDLISLRIDSDDLNEEIQMIKSTADIHNESGEKIYDAETGVSGDNIWSQQCGIESGNILTFVSGLGAVGFGSFETGYASEFSIVNIYENKKGEIIVDKDHFIVESSHNHTSKEMYANFFVEGKHELRLGESDEHNLGSEIFGQIVAEEEKTNDNSLGK